VKVIAIVGSPFAGKRTLGLALAAARDIALVTSRDVDRVLKESPSSVARIFPIRPNRAFKFVDSIGQRITSSR